MTQPTITPTTPATPPRNGFGVTALVLGIVGIVFSWVPVFGLLLGVLAVIFGAVGYFKARGGMAIAGLVLGAITVVIGIIVVAAVGSAVDQVNKDLQSVPAPFTSTSDAVKDVTVTECSGQGQFGMATVKVRVTNPTDRVQSYFVTVSVNDAAGNRLAEANGAANAVAPGQSANADLLGATASGAKNCTVANVSRIPS